MSATEKSSILDHIPYDLKKLTRFVVFTFCGFEHGLLIDVLIRNSCLLEDDIRQLLKFEPKQMRQILLTLKSEKIIKERQLVEQKNESSRASRQNYYYVNYKELVNVLKYKLDHMRKKLESEEKSTTHRAMYNCPNCKKTFTDLDVGFLWNGAEMLCTFCNSPVEEDQSAVPNQNTRSTLAKFNEQMLPFYEHLRGLDNIRLAPHLLEPVPKTEAEMNAAKAETQNENIRVAALGGRSTHDLKEVLSYRQNFSVNIEGSQTAGTSENDAESAKKEVPIWMRNSTVVVETETSHSELIATSSSVQFNQTTRTRIAGAPSDLIKQTLLIHEAPKLEATAVVTASQADTSESVNTQVVTSAAEEEEEMEFMSDEEDEEMVFVAGKQYPLSSVTPDLVGLMSADERQHYIAVSQRAIAQYE